MRKLCYFIFAVLLLPPIGCNHQSMTSQLAAIDSLIIKEQYDSAYNLTVALDIRQMTNEEDLAHYQLLEFQTCYLTDNPLPPDSILDHAITLFKKNKCIEKIAECYYYKGCAISGQMDFQKAIAFLKEAEKYSSKTNNTHLKFKISEAISMINSYSGNYKLTLKYGKEALFQAKEANRKDWMAYSFFRLGMAFLSLGVEDSALIYFDKMSPFIKNVREEDRPYFLCNLSLVYLDDHPDKSKDLLLESLKYKELAASLEQLASIYYNEGNHQEAYRLRTKALTINDLTPKDNIIHNLLEYDVEHGKIDKVCDRVNEIIAIKDSIIDKLKNDTIKDLQARFDQEVTNNEARERLIQWQRLLGLALVICFVLTALWLRKRHKMKEMQKERQIEIQNLISQLDDKRNEALLYKNQILELQAEQQKGSIIKEGLEEKMQQMEKLKEEAEQNLMTISQKIRDWAGAEAEKVRRGAHLINEVKENKSLRHWPSEDLQALVAYYCAINTDFARRINKTPRKLTTKQTLYLILRDMKKSHTDISDIMGIDKNSVRSYKYQIKQKEKRK